MKKFLLIVICIIPIFLSGCFALPVEEEVLPPPVANMPEARPIRTTPVVREDVLHFTNVRAGHLPARQETVHFGVAGQRVRGVFVSAGDMVSEGDILAELDRPYLFNQLADAQRDEEQIILERSQLETRHQTALNHAAETGIPVDDSSFTDERRRINDRLTIVRRRLEYLQQEIDRLYVRAPFDGIVIWALEVTGVMWSYLGQEVVTISDQTRNIFVITGPAAEASPPGTLLNVVIDDETFLVESIVLEDEDLPDRPPTTLPEAFLLIIEGNPPVITSLTVAIVHVVLDASYNVLAVPNLAINTLEGRSFVYVMEDDIVVIRDVVIGLEGNTLTEIISGLSEGEVIVL